MANRTLVNIVTSIVITVLLYFNFREALKFTTAFSSLKKASSGEDFVTGTIVSSSASSHNNTTETNSSSIPQEQHDDTNDDDTKIDGVKTIEVIPPKVKVREEETKVSQTLPQMKDNVSKSGNINISDENNKPKKKIDDHQVTVGQESKSQEGSSSQLFHYVIHIAKTGGTHFRHVTNKLLQNTKEWRALGAKFERPFLCDTGVKKHHQISAFPEDFKKIHPFGYKCAAYMAESAYNTRANYTYTILRQPKSHILSQYFHCKEAPVHKYGHDAIPSLDKWLEYWSQNLDEAEQIHIDSILKESKFKCYVPVNLQARLLNLSKDLILGDDEEAAMNEIESKFVIIGDNAQMAKTICSITIRYSGIVPEHCNCNHLKGRRRTNADHGVIHHGNTFNVTDKQMEWIDQITKVDQKLYEYGKIIFAQQVEKLEEEFGVRICDSLSI
jgi:hypothetical protein